MAILDRETAEGLLQIDSIEGVEDFLEHVYRASILEDDSRWIAVGGLRSNAGSIEASADEINPLVERIVNSIESVIELAAAEAKYEPESASLAIQELFSVPEGATRSLDDSTARSLGEQVVVTLRGDRNSPTLVVRDKGIGIHPTDFVNTVVALGQSRKGEKPYLVGMYGQGGSSTFDKCEYTVIVSRRAPEHLALGQRDSLGWTVVRRRLQGRANVYSYLVDPYNKGIQQIERKVHESLDFDHGTYIAHVGYRGLGGFATQQITNNAFYTLNYRLFDPLLPWTLKDERRGMEGHRRTMRGIPHRAGQLSQVTGIGSIEARRRGQRTAVRHHVTYDHRLASGSMLRVEWWVFQDEQAAEGRRRRDHAARIDPYRDRTRRYRQRVVAITRGGQTHAALTSQLFRKSGLKETARSIIVNVNTDGMSFEEGAGFFASNRADLKVESERVVEEAISAAVELHGDDLRAIERERQAEIVAGRSASDEERIRRRLDPLIQAFHRSISRGRGGAESSGRQSTEFHGKEIPTYIRFAQSSLLRIQPGVPSHTYLLTDAADPVVRSSGVEMKPESNNELVGVQVLGGQRGRYRLEIFPSAELLFGTQISLGARLSRPGIFEVSTDRPRLLEVVPPPPPWEGTDPPTLLKFRSDSGLIHVRQGGARITMTTDARDDFLVMGGDIDANSALAPGIELVGISGPNRGEIRVSLKVAEDCPLGAAGNLTVTMKLVDGARLSDTAELVVDERSRGGGASTEDEIPAYTIHDVREIKEDQSEYSWADMPRVLGDGTAWTAEDVGAFYVQELDGGSQIHFYLNVDNSLLRQAERRVARQRSENEVDSLRQFQRTVLCGHLYAIARPASDSFSAPDSAYWYRDEMIRLNSTAMYAHQQFIGGLDLAET